MRTTRRDLILGAPAAGLAGLLAGCAASAGTGDGPDRLYRVDDETSILAAARAIIAEDWVAALITVDEKGVPRARSVGVSDPEGDLTMWIATRRTSRKVEQIRRNPVATLYFNRDDLEDNFQSAYYASFMGRATVHIDEQTIAARSPDTQTIKTYFPNYPYDFAVIRFKPQWLEVYGHGIKGET